MGVSVRPLCGLYPKPLTPCYRCAKLTARRAPSIPRRRRFTCLAFNNQNPASERVQPAARFTEEDLRRIEENGPSINDLKRQHEVAVDDGSGTATMSKVEYVPPSVLGKVEYEMEPQWSSHPRMNMMEFYQGLRERNWRSEDYNPEADPWRLKFFVDSGRLFRPSYPGYRVLVTPTSGESLWVDLPESGVLNFLEDSALERNLEDLAVPTRMHELASPLDYGYNQVLEQLHFAFEERVQGQSAREYASKGWISQNEGEGEGEGDLVYDCPGERLLDVSFHLTPNEPCLHNTWDILPSVLFVSFAFSFLGVCLTLGIFNPRKQMPTDPMQAMEFAQSKGKARVDGKTDVTFQDVAGLDSIINDLKEIVNFLMDPEKFKAVGAKPPKGVLLEGPPGTGKTLIAKAIAGEAGVPFYQMSGSEFVEAIVGVGAARVRDLFKRARAQDCACIIFVDEIDALGIKRAEAGIQTNEEREQTLNQLLTEMDGFTSEQGVVFVGATNRADLLDPALTRAGRFDRKVRVLKPDTDARHEILQVHARKYKRLSSEVDLMQLSRDLPGLSGAELENVLNEAALSAVRREGDEIVIKDIYSAVDRVLQGIRHPIHPKDMPSIGNVIAAHEMGRAIVAYVLRERTGRLEAVERVSMVPRGKDWSRTIFFRLSDEDYTMTTKAKVLDRIRVVMAGRAAEDLCFEDPTTYGNKDLEAAFKLAMKVVGNYNMSDLGITTYAPVSNNQAFMRRSFEVNIDNIDEDLFGKGIKGGMFQPSESTIHRMRMQAHQIMWDAYRECLDILSNYSDAHYACSKLLLDKEEIIGSELENMILKNPPLQPDEEMVQEQNSMSGTNGTEEHAKSQAVSLEAQVSKMVVGKTKK